MNKQDADKYIFGYLLKFMNEGKEKLSLEEYKRICDNNRKAA